MFQTFNCDKAEINNVKAVESILAVYEQHSNMEFVIEVFEQASPDSGLLIRRGQSTKNVGSGSRKRKRCWLDSGLSVDEGIKKPLRVFLDVRNITNAPGMVLPYTLREELVRAKTRWATDRYQQAYQELCDEEGEDGFIDLLSELGPYLETPLTIVVARFEGDEFAGAKEWTVEPGANEVKVQEVRYMCDGILVDFGH